MELVLVSVFVSILLYIIFKLFGNAIKQKFNLFSLYPDALLGGSFYFAAIMVLCAPLTIFKVSTTICTLLYCFVLFAMLLYGIFHYKQLKWKSFLIIIPVVLIVGLLLYRSSFYSLGSTSDSVFYLSMVNENAFSPFWIPLEYYTGTPVDYNLNIFQPQYDFQAFYHLFSYIIKIVAQFIDVVSYSPVFVWSALSLFLLLMTDSILSIFTHLYTKNKLLSFFFILFAVVFSSSCWNLLYAYMGNSWRMLFITLAMMAIYAFVKDEDIKDIVVLAIASGGLIASTSSAIFINTFIIVSLMVYVLVKKLDVKYLLATYLSFSWTGLFAFCYFYCISRKLAVIFSMAYVIVSLFVLIFTKFKENIRTWITYACVGLFIVAICCASFLIVKDYTLMDFFKRNVNEMTINYFVFDDLYTVLINSIWIICLIVLGYTYRKNLKSNNYVTYLLVTIILFLNPISAKVWMQFIAGAVFYRSYEIFFNYFNFIFFAYGAYLLTTKIKIMMPVMIICTSIGIYGNYNDNPYTFDLDTAINPIYRIPENELEADLALEALVKKDGYRVRTISQAPFTKGFVNNINLSFGISKTREFCRTCNVLEGPVEELSPIYNIFFLRDYADQMIFSVPADYDSACDLLFERNFKYLLLDKEQTRKENGVYVPVFHCLRACNDVVFENDRFVVMVNRYVQ